MKYFVAVLFIFLNFTKSNSEDLKKCKWDNTLGTPCLTIFSAPNTSKISEGTLGKTVITKKQMIESGYNDVRSLLEHVTGIDVYSDGPRGQKTSVFMRGTNSNHTLITLNGISIQDNSTPNGTEDLFAHSFLGVNHVEVIKGPMGSVYGPNAIGGVINMVTQANGDNYIELSGGSFGHKKQIIKLDSKAINYSYRKSNNLKNKVILSAILKFEKENPEKISKKMSEFNKKRKKSQPPGIYNAGSVFKNSIDYFAGELIEKTGLKGYSIDKVSVSTKHANFFIAKKGAKASSLFELVQHVKEKVNDKYGVMLEEEIQFIGDFN